MMSKVEPAAIDRTVVAGNKPFPPANTLPRLLKIAVSVCPAVLLCDVSAIPKRKLDPLMGWVSSADTNRQVRLRFETEAEAVAYAGKHGYDYSLAEPKTRKIQPKSYADNFKFNRVL